MSRWPGPQGLVGTVQRILSDGVPSVTTDDLDIGTADFVASGDVLRLPLSWGVSANTSTTSDSFVSFVGSEFNLRIVWDDLAPDGVTTTATMDGRADPNGDEVTVRAQNRGPSPSEAVIEKSLTGSGFQSVHKTVAYEPANPGALSDILWQFKNSDGATSVTVDDLVFTIGIQL